MDKHFQTEFEETACMFSMYFQIKRPDRVSAHLNYILTYIEHCCWLFGRKRPLLKQW